MNVDPEGSGGRQSSPQPMELINLGLVVSGTFLACMPTCLTAPIGIFLILVGVYRILRG